MVDLVKVKKGTLVCVYFINNSSVENHDTVISNHNFALFVIVNFTLSRRRSRRRRSEEEEEEEEERRRRRRRSSRRTRRSRRRRRRRRQLQSIRPSSVNTPFVIPVLPWFSFLTSLINYLSPQTLFKTPHASLLPQYCRQIIPALTRCASPAYRGQL